MPREQQIVKPQDFGKFQIAIMWERDSERLQQQVPHMGKGIGIRIPMHDEKAPIPSNESKLAAGHDLYHIEDILIQANNRALVRIGLPITVRVETYGRLARGSGLATIAITIDGKVIDPHYRGEVIVLLVKYGKID